MVSIEPIRMCLMHVRSIQYVQIESLVGSLVGNSIERLIKFDRELG